VIGTCHANLLKEENGSVANGCMDACMCIDPQYDYKDDYRFPKRMSGTIKP
jgi:hypothetical protein